MPTIPELEQALMDAANNGDMATITSIVTTLTPQEKQFIDPLVFGYTLSGVANYTSFDPGLAASTAGIFMDEVGLYTNSNDISQAFHTFSMWGNLAGVDAMVDNTDPQIFQFLDPIYLGATLENVANTVNFDPSGAVVTAANFLSDLSLYTNTSSIGQAMYTFSLWGSLDGVTAVVNNTDTQMYQFLDPIYLGATLENVANTTNFDPTGSVAAATNFLSHLSLYTDTSSIGQAMYTFSLWGNLDGVTAVVNNTDSQVYQFLDPIYLGATLENAADLTNFDPAGSVAAVANFLSHLSLYTDTSSIGQAMYTFSLWGNLDGVTAVVNNTNSQIYQFLDPTYLGASLENVANTVNFDPDGSVAATANFLSHLSLYTNTSSISQALGTFSSWGSLDGVNAVVDNTNAQVFQFLDPAYLGFTLENVANLTSFADDHDVAGTLRNFSESLSAYTPGVSIETALQATSSDGNLAGFSGVLDHVSSTQWDALSSGFKSGLGSLGITVGTYAANTYAGTNNVDKYFGLGGNDNISGKNGNDFLYGNAGVDIVKGENGNDVLSGGIGADTLTGGGGSDTFVLDNTSGIDKITDFAKASGGDKLDFRDIVSEYDAGDPISQFVAARNVSGNTIVSFDADGAGGAAAVDIAQLTGVTNVNIDTLFAQGQILI